MLIPLSNEPRDYAWGSPTLIPALQGRAPDGTPEAEIWFGDHPGDPSLVEDGSGRTLDALLDDRGEQPLPYLLKVLAAASSLSIQAHPSKTQAVDGFAREEAAGIARGAADRTYRDDNHKPEIIVALSDVFRALVGLRPLVQTRRLVAALGDGPGPTALAQHLDGDGDDDAAALRATLAWVLSGQAQAEVDDIISSVMDAADAEFSDEIAVLRRIAADFPGDPGVVVALLMNLVQLRRGEAVFAPAGVLHAYQDGLGVELMAASDNVLRGGLTPKHVDVAELLRIVDTTAAAPPLVRPQQVDGIAVFDVGIPDFRLTRIAPRAGEPHTVAVAGPTIALVTGGRVEVSAGAASRTLSPGQAVFLTPDETALQVAGSGEVYIAQPGVA
ncbi:mannose-6-phosphate isomerase, class I [Microbacterium invictum]|uniref:mannose-6-phosphate isomerase n=1 Tax=Microbacterium invictum TaxID=515415 RepID=A0AA40SP61_9MICO|nr:mannose-6-phosphate isomerase, class I [Microbacterium invictum]MBB4139749.1 mannose-6-phosphate isomerase [Microbacterium invictum]